MAVSGNTIWIQVSMTHYPPPTLLTNIPFPWSKILDAEIGWFANMQLFSRLRLRVSQVHHKRLQTAIRWNFFPHLGSCNGPLILG